MSSILLKVLIVEDNAERQKVLCQLYKDHAWVLVHTAARAIKLLSAFRFDLISLDYDLAGDGKGRDVASYLAQSPQPHGKILIHSMNAPGAEIIKDLLPEAQYVPFSRIIKSNTVFKKIRQELSRGIDINWDYVFGREEPPAA